MAPRDCFESLTHHSPVTTNLTICPCAHEVVLSPHSVRLSSWLWTLTVDETHAICQQVAITHCPAQAFTGPPSISFYDPNRMITAMEYYYYYYY